MEPVSPSRLGSGAQGCFQLVERVIQSSWQSAGRGRELADVERALWSTLAWWELLVALPELSVSVIAALPPRASPGVWSGDSELGVVGAVSLEFVGEGGSETCIGCDGAMDPLCALDAGE
jgi:hypothetical protein